MSTTMSTSSNSSEQPDPSAIRNLTDAQKLRLTDLLDQYLVQLEQGLPPRVDRMLVENPDLAVILPIYLQHLESLHGAAAGFTDANDPRPPIEYLTNHDDRQLGDFQLVRVVGRGGMGIVYEAKQASLDRRVAVKVLPFAAVLDSKQIARFKNEAQAAAQVLHPNIVPVFAVGADRGVHYYAMQFIEGQPLDRAIRQLRGNDLESEMQSHFDDTVTSDMQRASNDVLRRQSISLHPESSPDPTVTLGNDATVDHSSYLTQRSPTPIRYFRARARLGIQAADALHAAHEYGVVHRDIKPSNLLVDHDGKLWITDFGLARCQSNASLTKTGDLVGTLRYMSPEQVTGNSAYVDHRTDIYSLGATLYELLTLRPVFSGDNSPELLRQIESHEPARPRSLRQDIPKDLEVIVSKAMAKFRDERYMTAKAMSEDLRCFLDGRPTVARPPSLIDRSAKWARRHVRTVAATAAIGSILTIAFGVSTVLVLRATKESERNLQRARDNMHATKDALMTFALQLPEELAEIGGTEQVRRKYLRKCKDFYNSFFEQSSENPDLMNEAALWHSKLGDLECRIGSSDDAIDQYQAALTLYDQLHSSDPSNITHQRHIGLCHANIAQSLAEVGNRQPDAMQAFQLAIQCQEKLVAASNDWIHLADLARTQNNLALLHFDLNHRQHADQFFKEAIKHQKRVVNVTNNDDSQVAMLATYLHHYSRSLPAEKVDLALRLCRFANRSYEALTESDPDSLEFQASLARTRHSLGLILAGSNRFEQAHTEYNSSMAILRRLHDQAPTVKSYLSDLALLLNDSGRALQMRCDADPTAERASLHETAKHAFAESLSFQRQLIQLDPTVPQPYHVQGGIYNNLGLLLEQCGDLDAAARAFDFAIEAQSLALRKDSSDHRYREFLSKHYYNAGQIQRKLNRPSQAIQFALQRRELWNEQPERWISVAEELTLAAALFEQASHKMDALQQALGLIKLAKDRGAVTSPSDLPPTMQPLRNLAAFSDLFAEYAADDDT